MPHTPMHGPGTTLSNVAGDTLFFIALGVSRELEDLAAQWQLGHAELVAILLLLNSLLTVLPGWLAVVRTWLWGAHHDDGTEHPSDKGLLGFLGVFGQVAQRLVLGTLAQTMAQGVATAVPLRSVRVITLVGVAVFFVFLSSTLAVARRDAIIARKGV